MLCDTASGGKFTSVPGIKPFEDRALSSPFSSVSIVPMTTGHKMKMTTSSVLLPVLGLLLLSPRTHAFPLHSFFGSGSCRAATIPPTSFKIAAGVATTEEASLSKVHTGLEEGGREGGREGDDTHAYLGLLVLLNPPGCFNLVYIAN